MGGTAEDPAEGPSVRVEHEVILAGQPDAEPVLRLLQERGCDLIVVGTHGRSGLRHLLIGGESGDVVREAECPVMVVKAAVPEGEAASRPMVGRTMSRGAT
ncbi:universal stress protein [Paludisphaera mucosa]|uniref:universal stress protein n=1 Tax=Paludisphaera mucosa TaxID=3030827 RepID=UPI0034A19C9F